MKLLKLLSITKLQNLKAIHNDKYIKRTFIDVVINRKTTKFESNSQQIIRLRIVSGKNQKDIKSTAQALKIQE